MLFFRGKAITLWPKRTNMELMQFTAVVLLTLLTLKLLVLPSMVTGNMVANHARWLMVISLAMLAIQFLLQYKLGLRAMGVTQAVMLNLVFFIPASWLFSVAVLLLQRQGHITKWDRWIGLWVWIVALVLISVAATIDGQPLLSETPELFWAEVAASACYLVMQGYYDWRHITNLRAMRQALDNYYDQDMHHLLRWMRLSVLILPTLALMVPLLIFVNHPVLAIFSLIFFGGIYYMVDNFCSYIVSPAPKKVLEAEASEEQEKMKEKKLLHANIISNKEVSDEQMKRVNRAVDLWIKKGGYLQNGMKLPLAAEEIGVPQYQLTNWLRQKKMKYNEWITCLRIEEAQRIIVEHPDWSNEAIAQHCGFADRSYFQRVFKEKTGKTPSDYA